MPRSTNEWIGANANSRAPARVQDRVCQRNGDRCQGPCGLKLGGKLKAEMDHIIALINWIGEGHGNRESNLQPLCQFCHQLKTKIDMAAKSITAKIRKRNLGIRKSSTFPTSRDGKFKVQWNRETRRFETVARTPD